jgi:transcriptional regulator with XRE-family HTH domain
MPVKRGDCSVFGQALAEKMLELGWKQNKLADMAGVGKGTVSNALNRQRPPSWRIACAIGKAVGWPETSVADLLYGGITDDVKRELEQITALLRGRSPRQLQGDRQVLRAHIRGASETSE